MEKRVTHTYAELEISPAAYDEIAKALRAAGYDHVFHGPPDAGVIDMNGIGLLRQTPERCEHGCLLSEVCDACKVEPQGYEAGRRAGLEHAAAVMYTLSQEIAGLFENATIKTQVSDQRTVQLADIAKNPKNPAS